MFGLYYGFSGQGIQMNLRCINEITVIQDGDQTASIGIQDGGQAYHLKFKNKESYTSRTKTLQLECTVKIPCGISWAEAERLFKLFYVNV